MEIPMKNFLLASFFLMVNGLAFAQTTVSRFDCFTDRRSPVPAVIKFEEVITENARGIKYFTKATLIQNGVVLAQLAGNEGPEETPFSPDDYDPPYAYNLSNQRFEINFLIDTLSIYVGEIPPRKPGQFHRVYESKRFPYFSCKLVQRFKRP